MPITFQNDEPGDFGDVSALLVKNGEPTLQAETLDAFLEGVDFDPVFDQIESDPELADLIDVEEGHARWDEELQCWVECEKDHPDAVEVEIQSLDGDSLNETVDTDDLVSMLDFAVVYETDHESLSAKVAVEALGYDMEAVLAEAKGPFKKGSFRKMRQQNPALVNRMLGAMIAKQVIKRAKAKKPGTPKKGEPGFTNQGGQKGSGYRSGDYDRYPAGYGKGTPRGLKVWQRYRQTKKAEIIKQGLKASKKKVNVGGMKVGGKKSAQLKKELEAGKKKAKSKKAGKSKKKLAASVEGPGANLSESERAIPTSFSAHRHHLARSVAGRKVEPKEKTPA